MLKLDSPYYHLYDKQPNYYNLHTFDCVCFVHLSSHECYKLSVQSSKCVFMGYSTSQKSFVCYDPTSNKFCISRNIVFFKN